MKATNTKETGTAIRVLKRAVCPSISGKSTLVYEVGVDEKKDIHLRVVQNSGRGMFNKDWVALRTIQGALDKTPKGEPVTSNVLLPLTRGVSVNTTGFLWAALVDAGFLAPSSTTKRAFEKIEPTRFHEEIKALIDGKPLPKGKQKKSATKPVVPADQKPSVPTKKKR